MRKVLSTRATQQEETTVPIEETLPPFNVETIQPRYNEPRPINYEWDFFDENHLVPTDTGDLVLTRPSIESAVKRSKKASDRGKRVKQAQHFSVGGKKSYKRTTKISKGEVFAKSPKRRYPSLWT